MIYNYTSTSGPASFFQTFEEINETVLVEKNVQHLATKEHLYSKQMFPVPPAVSFPPQQLFPPLLSKK